MNEEGRKSSTFQLITKNWLKTNGCFVARYTIEVYSDWESLNDIKVQMCDWLYQCQDARITNTFCTSPFVKENTFEFCPKSPSSIYKMKFSVNFFNPAFVLPENHDFFFKLWLNEFTVVGHSSNPMNLNYQDNLAKASPCESYSQV